MSSEEKHKNEIVSKLRTICSCGELKLAIYAEKRLNENEQI